MPCRFKFLEDEMKKDRTAAVLLVSLILFLFYRTGIIRLHCANEIVKL